MATGFPRSSVLAILLAAALAASGCARSGDGPPGDLPDALPADALADVSGDPAPEADTPADTAVADLPPGDDGSYLDGHGFRVRLPRLHTIPIEGPGIQTGWSEAWDRDWMCTFLHGDVAATFYIQDRPLKDRGWILGGITWQTAGAWMSAGGDVQPVEAQYDSGGNHLNDYVDVEYRGALYRYFHSSMSSAWRKCQAPDCLQRLDPADGMTVLEDGCTHLRTLPVWCVEVGHDGQVPPLTDAFHKCPSDPYP